MVIRFKKTYRNYKEIDNLFLNKYGKIMASDTASLPHLLHFIESPTIKYINS